MPELPEVETIRRDLLVLIGQSIRQIETSFDIQNTAKIQNVSLRDIVRNGKYLTFIFENNWKITAHLRMTGQLLLSQNHEKYERARFVFDNSVLIFADMRKFGTIEISKNPQLKVGIDILSDDFTEKCFLNLVKGKKGSIKSIFLSQKLFSGIGNIYADEICFDAGILPDRAMDSLNQIEKKKLYQSIKGVIELAVFRRGTSFSDYKDASGKRGTFQNQLMVYSRAGESCKVCGNTLNKTKVQQRTTVFCSYCQK
ncbi:MAG: bifunctional DNA-formamidopyrimidine glycosylase/DNA-(apurinic or apyrimidinic site) lyase [Candidatus Gracilibacteria bacterium]|jgi:formamidopyrimidine-DNA glycosylase|nr:bifunctional DNA-formamidopyrimidine glycosylase/DNA-(apurinic or apyrimidinic site) lyase [Candidatus Gracilibacteria bacterium]